MFTDVLPPTTPSGVTESVETGDGHGGDGGAETTDGARREGDVNGVELERDRGGEDGGDAATFDATEAEAGGGA